MSRIITCGFETGAYQSEGQNISLGGAGVPALILAAARSGRFGARASNPAAVMYHTWSALGLLVANDYYLRMYIRESTALNGQLNFIQIQNVGTLRLNSSGTLTLRDPGNTADVFTSTETINDGGWHRVEIHFRNNSVASTSTIELRLDGNIIYSSTTSNSTTAPGTIGIGWVGGSGSTATTGAIDWDDVAFNIPSGANNSWPGSGKIVLLLPGGVTNNQLTAATWTDGAGGVTAAALAAASDNAPPVGNTILASAATDQIEDAIKNTAAIYEPITETYASAGVTNPTKLMEGIAVFGQDSTTASQIGLQITSQVGGSASAEALVTGPTTAAAPFSTTPAAWAVARTAQLNNQSPTLTNGALVKVRKVAPSSTVAMAVALMGVYVEYDPPAATVEDSMVLPVFQSRRPMPMLQGPDTDTIMGMQPGWRR